MVQVGRIRLGTKDGKRPVKLDTWRLTSRDKVRLEAAAARFGGTVRPWAERQGEFELVTKVSDLPIMLLPGQTISQYMELWSGGGCKRRCDGDTESLTDGPCLCDSENPECKPHTRLNVMLPDVPGLGMWRLDSTGWNAARELAGTAEFLEHATARGVLVPARLRIDQRTEVRDGQTKKYPVPVLDVDIRSLDAMQIAGTPLHELPNGKTELGSYTPAPPKEIASVSVEQGLEAAAEKKPRARTARSAEPIPAAEPDRVATDADFAEFGFGDAVPVPDDAAPIVAEAAKPAAEKKAATFPPNVPLEMTKAQLGKLGVLVPKLRDDGVITTERLWAFVAKLRHIDMEPMIELLEGRDEEGVLHWGRLLPNKDDPGRTGILNRDEASKLIDKLVEIETTLEEAPFS